jgi:hypothetical protein
MEALHYDVWEAWTNEIRKENITDDNITDPVLRHQEFFFEIDPLGMVIERAPTNNDDCYYIKANKDNIGYIIPKKFIGEMPFKPVKYQNIRLKKSDTIVWRFVQKIESSAIPRIVTPTKKIKQFVFDEFNPVIHSNPTKFIILKLISLSKGSKIAICSNVRCGKQSNFIILKYMLGNYAPKVIKPTIAKLWVTMKNNNYIVFDEITSWKPEHISNIEDMAAAAADESPDMDKYALDRNKNMEVIGLTRKSFAFTYNRPDELDKDKGKPFEKKFENPTKITDRYPRLLVSGNVISRIEKPNPAEAIRLMEINKLEMNKLVAKTEYLVNNIHLHQHHWKRDKSIFNSNIRYAANTKGIFDWMDAISDTQEEFNEWIIELNKCHTDYMEMINQPLAELKKENKGQSTFKVDDYEEMDLSGGKK